VFGMGRELGDLNIGGGRNRMVFALVE